MVIIDNERESHFLVILAVMTPSDNLKLLLFCVSETAPIGTPSEP